MFRGQYTYQLDAKSRLAIPAKLRKSFNAEANDTVVLNRGTAQCIEVYPLDEWNRFEQELLTLNVHDPKNARLLRMISQNTYEYNLDAQSRIHLPQHLLDYSKINKEVLILGVFKRIELWNPDVYAAYLEQEQRSYEEIHSQVLANK